MPFSTLGGISVRLPGNLLSGDTVMNLLEKEVQSIKGCDGDDR
jgi:hypothetical protein